MSQPEAGQPSYFSDRSIKHNLGRGHYALASCQFLLNSVQRFPRRSKKCQPIRGQGGHLAFPIGQKHKLGRGHMSYCILSCFVEFRSAVSEERSNMFQPIRVQDNHLVFPIGPKNISCVEDDEILLPVKFRWIPLSGFRGVVENVSASRRPGRPSCFSNRPKNTHTW